MWGMGMGTGVWEGGGTLYLLLHESQYHQTVDTDQVHVLLFAVAGGFRKFYNQRLTSKAIRDFLQCPVCNESYQHAIGCNKGLRPYRH